MEPEVAVDTGDGVEEGHLRLGIAVQLHRDAMGSPVEQLAGGDGGAAPGAGLGQREEIGDEQGHPLGAVGFDPGAIALDGNRPGLPPGDDRERHDDREQRRRHCRRHAMASDEAPRPVGARIGLRQHRTSIEETLDVVAEPARRTVAAPGLRLQGLEHDAIDVAGEVSGQPGRRGASRRGDRRRGPRASRPRQGNDSGVVCRDDSGVVRRHHSGVVAAATPESSGGALWGDRA